MAIKRQVKVCTIGGGSGMPVVNKALVEVGFNDIHSIVTTFDSGGYSGRMKTDERGKLLAFSDYWRSLISLWKNGRQKAIWEEMLRYRDGRGRNFGDIFFQFMTEKTGNLANVDRLFSELTGAELKGEVIPVSLEPADVCWQTESGKQYVGEHYFDEYRMSEDRVKKIWLEPMVEASEEAKQTLKMAEIIIVGPGSIYGSILVNFLPQGMITAYRSSQARKILIANLTSVANETAKLDAATYYKIFSNYLGKNSFDDIIEPDFTKINPKLLTEVKRNYAYEHSYLYSSGSQVNDIVVVDRKNLRLRHDVKKLSLLFKRILRS
ncbi:MAG TPA: 2-phospho-L-lactate transferase CofD family protein [Candidatus Woesebacteria bacterium]|nr:2-phospho-L-lactate transferase CofD family protein [Candidatus Woesebacteria bacterium]HRT39968.1 2-phospho-L-lactate transferase CofD family protein [Candidatus Woesebacteria bacterium]